MLTEEENTVLLAVYYACNGSTKANVSIDYINKKIPKEAKQFIKTWKVLKRLEQKGLVWFHRGRKAKKGITIGITKEGIKYLKQNKLI